VNENIINYIRQYRFTYTREAITQQLLKQGYDSAEVETVWQAVEVGTVQSPPPYPGAGASPAYQPPVNPNSGPTPDQTSSFNSAPNQPSSGYGLGAAPYYFPGQQAVIELPRLRSQPKFWLAFFSFLIGVPIVSGIMGGIGGSISGSGSTAFTLPIFFVAVVIGLIYAIRVNSRNRAVAQGIIYAIMVQFVLGVVVPFVFVIILLGICIFGSTKYNYFS